MRWLLNLAFVLLFIPLMSQDKSQFDFVQYLIARKQYPEALFVLNQLRTDQSINQDSVHFYMGESFFLLKKLDSSALYFGLISKSFSLYEKTKFFQAYNLAYLRDTTAKHILREFEPRDPLHRHLKNYELSGIALLERNYEEFEALSNNYTDSFYQIKAEQAKMLIYAVELQSVKQRSPVVAGVMSAVVPGLGKVYAGRWKQGLAYFGIMAALGAQTYEAYRKDGINDPFFYFYASAFTLFYVGNIWGSVFSVKIEQNEKFKAIDNRILFDLQIPLRTAFN